MAKTKQEAETGAHGTIAEAIRYRYGELTTTERKPAQTLLANYPFAGLETVARFAERAGVSGPTILRLVAKLGYSGYAGFQKKLRDELQAQAQSPLTKRPQTADGAAGRQPNFLESFGEAVTGNIEQTLESVHQSEFNAVVELLSDEKRPLYLLGGRFTGAVANYFYQHLHTLRPNVQLISGHESSWRNYLLDTGRRHVLVVFDIRRYQHDVIRFAEESARRGATVVLFTDQWLSPVSGIARHMLTARVTVPSSWDSMIGMFVIVEAMIARISEKMWPTVKSRVEELDRMLNPPEGGGE
ncbi:MAG: MurR/RpiR family transcriptional regulator [Proteobacteria bacterium]|nr:MurR/RpiR family transcriptional regulator [Pseudomonadota bacterium]MCK4866740.1 MurR/RpiR family transcriptional regulator [Alphaproteobacteria bacterium]